MKKYICKQCKPEIPCVIEWGDSPPPARCPCSGDMVEWVEVNHPPKLTVEALAERGIEWPDWARYAVVWNDGVALFYQNKPLELTDYGWDHAGGEWGSAPRLNDCLWDTSEWQNSLIERPAVVKESLITELPDWCRVGEWARIDSPGLGHGEIRRIKEIQHKQDGLWIVFDPLKGNHLVIAGTKNLTRFAIRPWTFAEAPARLKITKKSGEVLDLDLCVILSEGPGCYYIDNRRSMIEASELVKQIQPDGSPCGVLEVVK